MHKPSIELKTSSQFRHMAAAGQILSAGLDVVMSAVGVGITTEELDRIFADHLQRHGALSNFHGYYGYPATTCISVNEQVVHGIPSSQILREGDIVTVDAGAIVAGWHSDSARTTIVGEGDPEDERLCRLTEEALWHGIAAMAQGARVNDIGIAVEQHLQSSPGAPLGILEEYAGHGIGSAMHMEPDVLNYRSRMRGPKLRPGMALAIEPIVVRGAADTKTLDDGWTVVTVDGSRAAQWEHSVALHDDGIWVLSAQDGGAQGLAPWGIRPVPVPGKVEL